MSELKTEQIRSSINDMPQELLADALTLLLAKNESTKQADTIELEFANFAQALLYFKKNYDFPELDFFTTEADLVYVNTGDRRVLLTDRMNVFNGRQKQNAVSENNNKKTLNNNDAPSNDSSQAGSRFSNLEI